jgi:hypothetical protein
MTTTRRFAAILSHVVGYSRLMGDHNVRLLQLPPAGMRT